MTPLIIDGIILAVILFSAFLGYRRGLVLTLCGCVAVFVAYIGATAVSTAVAPPLSRTLQPGLESNIQRFLDEKVGEVIPGDTTVTPSPSGSSSAEETPGSTVSLQQALDLLKDTTFYKGFAESFQELVDKGMAAVTANAARVISEFIANQVARAVIFYLSFILILVLWHLLSHTLDLAFKLPVLSSLNGWGGALLGLARAVLILFIVCWLLGDGLIPSSIVNDTVLLKFFSNGPSILVS